MVDIFLAAYHQKIQIIIWRGFVEIGHIRKSNSYSKYQNMQILSLWSP